MLFTKKRGRDWYWLNMVGLFGFSFVFGIGAIGVLFSPTILIRSDRDGLDIHFGRTGDVGVGTAVFDDVGPTEQG